MPRGTRSVHIRSKGQTVQHNCLSQQPLDEDALHTAKIAIMIELSIGFLFSVFDTLIVFAQRIGSTPELLFSLHFEHK